jgi:ABC-type proline/glycine betaine transport system permease subunit
MKRAAWQRVLLSAWVRPVLLVALLLVAWDLAIRLFRIPPYLIPSPWSVVQQLFNEWPRLLKESIPTTYATLGGFALSIAFGIPMALMIAYSRTIESFVYPLLVFSQSVPKIAIAPLFVVWFGFGIIPKVIAAVHARLLSDRRLDRDGIQVRRPRHARSRTIDEGEPACDVPANQPSARAAVDFCRPESVDHARRRRCRRR